ncbi:MAG: 23S rRNA (uracil(1939)-C(5))-methyltransferase RlmD [Clostridia bacterium]
MALSKNSEHSVVITGYGSDGAGIARIDGQVVFIPGALQGETCRVVIVKANKNVAYGRLIEIITRSEHRVASECPVYPRCGGCDFWHMDYDEECTAKEARVRDAIERIGGITADIMPIVRADSYTRYRNKAQFPIREQGGEIVSGFFRTHSHDVVPCTDCKIQSELANSVCQTVIEWMREVGVPAFDELRTCGVVRHVFVRCGLLCVVVAKKPEGTDALVRMVTARYNDISGIVLNYNTEDTNVILGNRFETLYGSPNTVDTMCGLKFSLSPRAFYQVNRAQAERLYALALEGAALTGGETVLDLYCGVGTITLYLARHAGRAVGIEIIRSAIVDARKNAEKNGIKNVQFICADATSTSLAEIAPDVVVVDPPRKGLTPELVATLTELKPARLIYISCDPATMARDLKELTADAFNIEKITPVDMFPRTRHVECVVALHRVEK